MPIYERLMEATLAGEKDISGLGFVGQTIWGLPCCREWDCGVVPIYERLLEASLAGNTRIWWPCQYSRGCLRPVSPARLGCRGLENNGEAI